MSSEQQARDSSVELAGVSKCYRRYHKPSDWLREKITGRSLATEHWALRDVDLKLAPGESLGIVGRNGAGKSTLLQLIAGTLTTSTGRVLRNGRVAALLELGAGFNPEFTGLENARLNASIMGLSRTEIEHKLPGIIDFSGIGDAIHRPVRTYSSGMFVRLAFAVATATDPDILIIDEALSVGDGSFARKSFDRIMEIRDRGASLIFCSHSLYQVEQLCDRVIWVNDGQVEQEGRAQEVLNAYRMFIDTHEESTASRRPLATQQNVTYEPTTSEPAKGKAEILNVIIIEASGAREEAVTCLRMSEQALVIKIDFISDISMPVPRVACLIEAEDGKVVTSMGSWLGNSEPVLRDALGVSSVLLNVPEVPLLPGHYHVNVVLLCERGVLFYHAIPHCLSFRVKGETVQLGYVNIPHHWSNAGGG